MGNFYFTWEFRFISVSFLILLRSFTWRNDRQTFVRWTNPTFEFRFISDFLLQFYFTVSQVSSSTRAIETNQKQILCRGFRAFLRATNHEEIQQGFKFKRGLSRDPRISPQNPERSEELREPREVLRDKSDLERSMESREIAGNPRNCQRSTEFREIPRIRRSFGRISRDPATRVESLPRNTGRFFRKKESSIPALASSKYQKELNTFGLRTALLIEFFLLK